MVKTLTGIRLIAVLGILVGATIAQPSAQDLSRVQWVEEATLTGPNGTVDDDFGSAVAIDANTVVVGAPRAAGQGAAFVRIRFFGIWWPIAELSASGGAAGDWFGFSVAVADDTIVVGAPRADVDGKSDQGAAYVFTQTGMTWTQTATLTAASGAAGDLFGNAVAIDGHTIVVGAESAGARGRAHVFTDAGGVWTEAGPLTVANPESGPFFGKSVAIGGETIVVGAWGAGGGAGAAFVFTRTGSEWTETAELSGQTNAFGWSVAIFGNTVVVGATDFDLGTIQPVAQPEADGPLGIGPKAYVFTQTGGAWTEAARLVAPNGWQADAFGESVAMYGDRVVVGAPGAILIEEDRTTGAAFVYNRSGNTWTEAATLARGGRSVSTAGNTVVTGSGSAAYVFVRTLSSS